MKEKWWMARVDCGGQKWVHYVPVAKARHEAEEELLEFISSRFASDYSRGKYTVGEFAEVEL